MGAHSRLQRMRACVTFGCESSTLQDFLGKLTDDSCCSIWMVVACPTRSRCARSCHAVSLTPGSLQTAPSWCRSLLIGSKATLRPLLLLMSLRLVIPTMVKLLNQSRFQSAG